MNNGRFYIRVVCLVIMVGLTLYYITGGQVQRWWDIFTGFVYGMIIFDMMMTARRLKRANNLREKLTVSEKLNLGFFVVMTLCYATGDIVQSHMNWTSGLAYGLSFKGLCSTY